MILHSHNIGLIFSGKGDLRLMEEFVRSLGHCSRALDINDITLPDWKEISIIITDEESGRRHGETLVRIKKCSDVFTALLVAVRKKNAISRWLEFGFDDVLPMPFTKAELRARLTTFLRIREQSYELKERSDAMLKALVESSSDHIFMLDRDGTFVTSNNKMTSFFPDSYHNADNVVGRPLHEIYPPDLASALESMLKEVLISKKPVTREYAVAETAYATWHQYTLYPILLGAEVTAVGGICRDVTPLKEAQERAYSSLKEKDALLRELYHRTKNNMQVIIGMLYLQRQAVSDESVSSVFREVENKIAAMALVHQRLYETKDLSRIDLKEYVGDLLSLLVRTYNKGIQSISTEVEGESILISIETAIPCGLLLNELISNAFKHAFRERQKGVIKIGILKLEKGIIEIIVTDDGAGFPEGFDLRRSCSSGLQTVVSLVEHQLQGTIEMSSGAGSRFRITFRDE